jgi:hypothetical protein
MVVFVDRRNLLLAAAMPGDGSKTDFYQSGCAAVFNRAHVLTDNVGAWAF